MGYLGTVSLSCRALHSYYSPSKEEHAWNLLGTDMELGWRQWAGWPGCVRRSSAQAEALPSMLNSLTQ